MTSERDGESGKPVRLEWTPVKIDVPVVECECCGRMATNRICEMCASGVGVLALNADVEIVVGDP